MIVPPKPDKPKRGRAPRAPAPVVEAVAPTAEAAVPAATAAALVEPYGEALMPRWRRPSLKTARYAAPTIAPAPIPAMSFAGGATAGLERRRVRYDLVSLTDIPDEIQGSQVGQLQADDEVEIMGRQGAWVRVRTPAGVEGWIHRTTLRATDDAPTPIRPRGSAGPAAMPVVTPEPESSEADVAMGAFAAAAAARAQALEAAPAPATTEVEAEVKPAKRTRPRRPASPRTARNA